MKYVKFYNHGKVYHMIPDDSDVHDIDDCPLTYCNCWALYTSDTVLDNPPAGRLCKNCKKRFISQYSEADLVLEMI